MDRLISALAQWIGKKLLILLLILAVLVAGAWVKGEWERMSTKTAHIEEKTRILDNLAARRSRVETEIADLSEKSRALVDEVEGKAATLRNALTDVERTEAELKELTDENPIERYVPGTAAWSQIRLKTTELSAQRAVVETAQKAADSAQAILDRSPEALRARELARELSENLEDARLLESQIARARDELLRQPGQKIYLAALRQLPAALLILCGILLVPVVIKAFLYFVMAPLAARLPPVRILSEGDGTVIAPPPSGSSDDHSATISSVSIEVALGGNEELLIHPDYFQSIGLDSEKETQWFLNSKIPFTSIAAGLFALTRVRAGEGDTVVISSTKSPLNEVGVIELPEGAAIVCHPHSLAGVVKALDSPVDITRHWRLGSLHSWLTLQLRYLVIHGPCKLVLKGCRGIRVEQAGNDRLINQAATIGFSANLAHSNTRCETFVPYLRGQEDLFNDLFHSGEGCYIYEEMPHRGKAGLTGRGLEGLLDGVLKVFGI